MGDMADLLMNEMESGESLVVDKLTGQSFRVDNIELMYGHTYDDEKRYEIRQINNDEGK